MKFYELQVASWDKSFFVLAESVDLKVGGRLVITCDWGKEVATVVDIKNLKRSENPEETVSIDRIMTEEDKNRLKEIYVDEREAVNFCHEQVRKLDLPMKIVDAHFSLDKQRLVLAFIAQGRVDFRDLLKELTKKYHSNIRLQQIGVRDEARLSGDIGTCGFRLCCQTHLKNLGSVSSNMAQRQQVAHRGTDRLSGACGRLKCCLAFEDKQYDKEKVATGDKNKAPK